MTYKISKMNERCTKGVSNTETHTHDYVILQVMATGRVSPDEIAEGVSLTGRYTTKDPVIKSVNWHLNKLTKEGVVEIVTATPISEPVVKVAKQRKAA